MPPRYTRTAQLAAVIVASGLAIRFLPVFPAWFQDAGGGILYVCLLAVLLRLLSPKLTAAKTAALALALTCAVEFSQLLTHPAAIAIRSTLPGRLALGSTFSWWDFPPYFIGAALSKTIAKIFLDTRSLKDAS